MSQVAILMGSDSDLPVMNEAVEVFREFGISYDIKVLSAHRTPELVRDYVMNSDKQGVKLFIAGAGSAAHLAGVIAAHTIKPVIGVPIDSSPLQGFDSLLSTVQMPAGIPVATVAVGKSGARNAGILAVQILGVSDNNLATRLVAFKQKMVDGVIAKNQSLNKKLEELKK